jgi:methane/ammonia monooxygenase subunit C
MAQMPALIPKEVEIQRLKKIYVMVIMLGSIAASVEVDNFVDGSLHQTAIRDSAFTPAHWWLYSHFIALPLVGDLWQCMTEGASALRGLITNEHLV